MIVAEINKDLDSIRKTSYRAQFKEENKEFDKLTENEDKIRYLTTNRKISEAVLPYKNTLSANAFERGRTVTEDVNLVDRTGSFANPDYDVYQSKIVLKNPNLSNKDIVRTEECGKGYDSIDIFLSGMRIVLMNEQENIFYPVLDISISEVHFEKYSTIKASKGQTCTFISIFYYNATIGEWEPLMENFKLFVLMDAFSNKS